MSGNHATSFADDIINSGTLVVNGATVGECCNDGGTGCPGGVSCT